LLKNYSQEVCDGPGDYYVNCARCALARAGQPGLWPAIPALIGSLAWRNVLLRRTLHAADRLIAPTPFVYDWYAAHGAPTDTLILLEPALAGAEVPLPSHAPHPLGEVSDRRPALAAHIEHEGDVPLRFAYIGGLSQQKGVHVLVEAFAGVTGAAELWIAGDESFDPDYVAHLRHLATPTVRFLGRLSRAQVWDTLARVDGVVVPTLWYETFSFIVSEAFMMGLPVIASRIGPIADRVHDGVDGILVPPGDVQAWRVALQRLVDAPDLHAELQRNVAPPLTLDEHARQLEQRYAQLIG
jgi:glycosyltransferase involved in cell wall biosynthesis